MSHVDGFLVGACVQRFVRFMVYRPYYEKPMLRLVSVAHSCDSSRRGRDAVRSLERARKELEAGHVVCIFAEGEISRTANLLPFSGDSSASPAGSTCPSSRSISTACGAASSVTSAGSSSGSGRGAFRTA
jgi:acyl-[acyl-carrier-protein]-phospholipid O-acyltransferase/long-chain-fatty-acid--[acyl-carrier-protein] ligase